MLLVVPEWPVCLSGFMDSLVCVTRLAHRHDKDDIFSLSLSVDIINSISEPQSRRRTSPVAWPAGSKNMRADNKHLAMCHAHDDGPRRGAYGDAISGSHFARMYQICTRRAHLQSISWEGMVFVYPARHEMNVGDDEAALPVTTGHEKSIKWLWCAGCQL